MNSSRGDSQRYPLIDLRVVPTRSLFSLYGRLLDELNARGIVRSKNNPVADYAEWLVSKAFGLTLTGKSTAGCDARDDAGNGYEIKTRRITAGNRSRQLSPFRKLDQCHFAFFVGVLFDSDFTVMRGCRAPWGVVMENAVQREHVNGHVLLLRDSFWEVKGVEDITQELQELQYEEHGQGA